MAEKIKMKKQSEKTFAEVFESFITSQKAKDISEVTIRNYHLHLQSISKHLDIQTAFKKITKDELDAMIVSMKEAELAHNSIATYVRLLRTFYKWCNSEGISSLNLNPIKEKETVKDVYSDEELELLLKKPTQDCDFCEYRSWVIINFLLNCGCRAASIRNIQNGDVHLKGKQITLRHNKNGKIQNVPLCSKMVAILYEYMEIRKGEDDDYLFCNQYGEMLTESALRQSIAKYNRRRGVKKTSLHLFRHTFARKYLVDCNGNAFTLQKLLGHSTLAMTKHYCRIYDRELVANFDSFSPLQQMKTTERKTIKI